MYFSGIQSTIEKEEICQMTAESNAEKRRIPMRFIYKTLIIVTLLTTLTAAAACGGQKQTVEIDIEALTKALEENAVSDDILTEIDADYMSELYGIDDGLTEQFYVLLSTGATADEIAVFACADAEAADEVKAGVETRIQDQIDAYSAYIPAEVPKLEAAKIYTSGRYLAVCVSSDADAVEEIMEEYGF